jgi:hypothetical protein
MDQFVIGQVFGQRRAAWVEKALLRPVAPGDQSRTQRKAGAAGEKAPAIEVLLRFGGNAEDARDRLDAQVGQSLI